VISDENPFALVDTRTRGEDATPARLIRYQLANQADSVSIELDDRGDTISYQEYYPYGGTSYQAGTLSGTAMAPRYLFTGRERDEESGLYYHGARYYAPWLGRWTSCDPIGTQGGICLYAYVRNSPALRTDPEGTQDSAMRAGMEVYYARLERDVEGYITGFFGGHADVNMSQNEVEYATPEGGVGGVIGGFLRVLSDRLLPFEQDPTPESVVGAEAMASLVPVMDPSQRLALGTTVTGQPTSRLAAGVQLALDVVPTIAEIRMASAPARTASVVSHASSLERTGARLLGETADEAAEAMGSFSARTRSAPGAPPTSVARDVSSSAGAARRVREVVVPLSRGLEPEADTVKAALKVAHRRGAIAIWPEELANFPDVERVTFIGHGTESTFAGRNAEQLYLMVEEAGVRPSVIELAGCESAGGADPIARNLAFYGGADVVGYEREVFMNSGVVSDAMVMTDYGWAPMIPSAAEPITFTPQFRVPR
jgi:RHS repeat-associated protein